MLPSAHAVLWFLASFLALWGASVAWRGLFGDRARGRRRCPACWKDVATTAMACGACGYASERNRDFLAARRRWRLVGIGAAVLVGAAVSAYGGLLVYSWGEVESPTYLGGDVPAVGAWEASAWGVAAFGLALATWAWRGDRSRGRRRCPKCWYDMAGVGLKCPECGHEAGAVKRLYRPRRRHSLTAFGLVILLSSYGLWIVPRVRDGGWVAAVPTTLLIIGMPWLPDSAITDSDPGAEEDWTLYGRWLESAWTWQDAWIEARARGMARSGHALKHWSRASAFIDLSEEAAIVSRAHEAIVKGLTHHSPVRRAETAEHFDAVVDWVMPTEHPDRATIEKSVPQLLRGLFDPDREVASCCAIMLGFGGNAAETAVPYLVEMLGSRSSRDEQIAAMFSLMRLACETSAAREAILAATWRRDTTLVRGAVFALRERGVCDPRITPRLVQLLEHPSDQVASMAASVLAQRRADGPIAIPAILRQVDARSEMRDRFVSAAYSPDWDADEYFPELVKLLSNESAEVRASAAAALSYRSWSVDTSAAIPVLERLSADVDRDVAGWAESALNTLVNARR